MHRPEVIAALECSWSPETSYGGMATQDNPARGQCVVSSLVLQDYMGGDLQKVKVTGDDIDETHYYNVLDDGTTIDVTARQYDGLAITKRQVPIDLRGRFANVREKLLADDDTQRRYELLKKRVERLMSHGAKDVS